MSRYCTALILLLLGSACSPLKPAPAYDLLIRNGAVYDGAGGPAQTLDIAIRNDRVVAHLEPGHSATARREIDAANLAVAPGFINVLSWAVESLIVDGRGLSDLKQGVTLEIFGEGWSMGPLNQAMKQERLAQQSDFHYAIEWTTLGEYLEFLEQRGVAMNVASFVGATTVRIHELGYADRAPSASELKRMQALVDQAMHEGALGVGASLIYAPAFYADTPELIALAQTAAAHGGGFVAHMRSESDHLEAALDELLRIARASGAHTEAYHLKAAGDSNWSRMASVIAAIEAARSEGLSIAANMYPYTAGATGLDAAMPPWVQEGGVEAWIERLRDPQIRQQVLREMRAKPEDWESLYYHAGPDRTLFIGFDSPALKPLTGRTLAEVAAERGSSPEDTIIDLVIEDGSRVEVVYFLMSEENVRLGLSQPWVSIGSDAEASAPEGVFLQRSTHPRAYGSFARLLGLYARDQQLMSLSEAIRRLTRLPASNWQLTGRGCLDPGCYADVVVFDPATIDDHASYTEPRAFASGVHHVIVNGEVVLRDGDPTGALPGRVVRGPGWDGATD
ncbi:MAG: amidohydrolase family protein [Wenzhouxiangellaceae bacterium]